MRESFKTASGLAGWVSGDGPEILCLHGGPGFTDYMDSLLPELAGFRVASFCQRGNEPSTEEGPFDLATSISDVVSVVDELGWSAPMMIGHSWGGHLLLHLMAAVPERVGGALLVAPLGAVDDGGLGEFGEEMAARTPDADMARCQELWSRGDELFEKHGTRLPAAEMSELIRLRMPAYFADPDSTPDFPDLQMSTVVDHSMWPHIMDAMPKLADELAGCEVPTRFLVGDKDPLPNSASQETASLLGAPVDVVPDAGHLIWYEKPGVVRASLDKLLTM